jgi:hypothetical protein
MGTELSMNETLEIDPLDRQLREAQPYIDDNGFTTRVLSKVPAPRRRRNAFRLVVLPLLALLGSASAYVLSGGGEFLTINVVRLASLPTLWLLGVAFGIGLVMTITALFAGLTRTDELQP